MSDTPRTDACEGSDGTIRECDELAELCRQLERELAAAKRGAVVPREPTKEMLEAGYAAAAFPRDPEICVAMWKAMLSAAPQQIAAPQMPRDDEIRLAMGELTADQMRTAKSAIRWVLSRQRT